MLIASSDLTIRDRELTFCLFEIFLAFFLAEVSLAFLVTPLLFLPKITIGILDIAF